ncbi:MAG: tetratricopeptide repeat protein [Candidatus Limisoma sp.]
MNRNWLLLLFIFSVLSCYGDDQRTADSKTELAAEMLKSGNVVEALPLLNEAKRIYEKIGETSIANYARNLYLLGECHISSSPAAAKKYSSSAAELYRRLSGKDNREFIDSYRLSGRACRLSGDAETALTIHKEATELLRKQHADNRVIASALDECGDDYAALEEYGNAVRCWDEARGLVDKYTKAYDGYLRKSIDALKSSGATEKKIGKYNGLMLESDVFNGRADATEPDEKPVFRPEPQLRPNGKKQEIIVLGAETDSIASSNKPTINEKPIVIKNSDEPVKVENVEKSEKVEKSDKADKPKKQRTSKRSRRKQKKQEENDRKNGIFKF